MGSRAEEVDAKRNDNVFVGSRATSQGRPLRSKPAAVHYAATPRLSLDFGLPHWILAVTGRPVAVRDQEVLPPVAFSTRAVRIREHNGARSADDSVVHASESDGA